MVFGITKYPVVKEGSGSHSTKTTGIPYRAASALTYDPTVVSGPNTAVTFGKLLLFIRSLNTSLEKIGSLRASINSTEMIGNDLSDWALSNR